MTTSTLPLQTPPPAEDEPTDSERRTWVLGTGLAGGAGLLATAAPLVSSFAPSERARAGGAPVEVNIDDIPPGGIKTVEWRGKPVWVVRRTPEMLAALKGQESALADPESLRDQQPDHARNGTRSTRAEVFVAVGICTHLGCSPTAVPMGSANPSVGENWRGGFFCPCHGSTFDGAGRVFKNKPAPTNLEVPPHRYASDTRLIVGENAA